MGNLYLEAAHVCSDGSLLPLTTTSLLGLLDFCGTTDTYQIHLVYSCEKNEVEQVLQHVQADLVTFENLPEEARMCNLPVLSSYNMAGPLLVHSGLGCVARSIVKSAHAAKPNTEIGCLLGRKEVCLKACSEVSAWTRFCEVEVPREVQKCLLDNGMVSDIPVPVFLMRLEQHLGKPAIIPNIGKKRRQVAQATQQQDNDIDTQLTPAIHKLDLDAREFDDKDTGRGSRSTEQPLTLDHIFAEGTEMTLTDIILYFSLHPLMGKWKSACSNIEQVLPKVHAWYGRMSKVIKVKVAIRDHTDMWRTTEGAGSAFKLLPLENIQNLDIRDGVPQKIKAHKKLVADALCQLQNSNLLKTVQDHPCKNTCALNWSCLPKGVQPGEGELPIKRQERKCQQLESMLAAIKMVVQPGNIIVDFCSGGGHLGILIAQELPKCKVILVENKEESLQRAIRRIKETELQNVSVCQCNLGHFRGRFDVGTCLHACGTATDLVLDQCLRNQASFVICPCCYGSIHDTHSISFPRSRAFLASSVNNEIYYQLGHAADQPKGSSYMASVDSDRCLYAEEQGYQVSLALLEPPSCSPKNHILIGSKPR